MSLRYHALKLLSNITSSHRDELAKQAWARKQVRAYDWLDELVRIVSLSNQFFFNLVKHDWSTGEIDREKREMVRSICKISYQRLPTNAA